MRVFFLIASINIGCMLDLSHLVDKELDQIPPTVYSMPAGGSIVQSLENIKLTYSENVKNLANKNSYYFSGTGKGSLEINSISETIQSREVLLNITGKPSDGNFDLNLRNIKDKLDNDLSVHRISFIGDGLPKWRYLGRKLSRGEISVANIGLTGFGNKLAIVYSDEQCATTNGGHDDITAIMVDLATKEFSAMGSPCISQTTLGNTSSIELYSSNNEVYLAYRDGADSNFRIMVKKWDGASWISVGNDHFSTGKISNPRLLKEGNQLFVAFKDRDNSSKLTVYRKDLSTQTNWVALSPAGISQGNSFSAAPMFYLDNKLMVAYRDGGRSNHPYFSYYDFNTASWSTASQIDNQACANPHLLYDKEKNELFAAYQITLSTRQIRLRKYNFANKTWANSIPDFDTNQISSLNPLQCLFIESQPHCATQPGSDFSYYYAYKNNSWQEIKSPNAASSEIIGANTVTMYYKKTIFLAIRDTDRLPYTNRLALLTYH